MNHKQARILFILGLAAFAAVLIFGKLFYVQVLASEKYKSDSLNNRLQEVEVVSNRGIIYDCNDEALAVSVEKESVYITPSAIRDSDSRDEIVKNVADCLNMSESEVNKIVDDSSGDFAWLKRHAEKEETEKLKKYDYLGIGFTSEYEREYPNGNLLSHVLGFTGVDNQGLAGVELQYNDELAGTPGKLVVEYDKLGNAIPQSVRESIPASQGENLHLTIDSTIQYYVESALNKAQEEQKAASMTCIVMDVNNADILAMANLPDFDPNNYSDSDAEDWSNLAVSKLYEPGSPFKSLTTSMALEEDIVEPDTQMYCNGYLMIDGNRFQDWDYPSGDGAQTMKHALEQSCNVAQAENVSKLGADRFYEYLDGFGMTQATGIDLPSESSPLLIDKEDAVSLDLASEAIGQGNAYTALQMITAFSAVVNGGHLMKPHIVDRITDSKDKTISETQPEEVRRVISDETSEQMRDMLEGVVTEGLGTPAAVEGYRVGGKTGTAEIASDGSYEEGNYILSFMGFAPVEDPRFACIVIVDSPASGGNSGTLAGGIFSEIAGNILNYMQIPQTEEPSQDNEDVTEASEGNFVKIPDLDLPMDITQAEAIFEQAGLNVEVATSGSQLMSYLPVAGTKAAVGSTVTLYGGEEDAESVTLPDLSGHAIKDVDVVLQGFGLKPSLTGSGLAYRQQPAAGSVVSKGDQVKVWFASVSQKESIDKASQELESSKNKTSSTTSSDEASSGSSNTSSSTSSDAASSTKNKQQTSSSP